MKSLSTHLHPEHHFNKLPVPVRIAVVKAPLREIMALLSAVTVATGFVLLSVGLGVMGVVAFASATMWGMALVFFGLAVDSRRPLAILQSLTGLALVVLAWLQHAVSAEYLVVSGALIAAWAVVVIFERLK